MPYPLQAADRADNANDLLLRFRRQMDKVEQLMNASMRPLMRQKSLLSEESGRQALETLERWSQLYRHGLEASGMIAERGEEWLREAHQRLSLTADELRNLDMTAEALASEKRAETARHAQKTIDKIKSLIVPIADDVKTPVADSALSVA
jgi:hypothetical protein